MQKYQSKQAAPMKQIEETQISAYERCKIGKNGYTQTMSEVKLDFDQDIINKCTGQLEFFFNYINSKNKSRYQISTMKDNIIVYTKEEEMCEIVNKNFSQCLFRTHTLKLQIYAQT